MNLGIYIKSLQDIKQLEYISQSINVGIEKKEIKDASIFYDDIAFNPFNINCGMFNSTDLWNFKGKLVATSLSCVANTINIVNDIDLYYYYGWEEKPKLLDLLYILQQNVKVICTDEHSGSYIYRVTGKIPFGICDNFNGICELIKG
jgi:hypothetical protein